MFATHHEQKKLICILTFLSLSLSLSLSHTHTHTHTHTQQQQQQQQQRSTHQGFHRDIHIAIHAGMFCRKRNNTKKQPVMPFYWRNLPIFNKIQRWIQNYIFNRKRGFQCTQPYIITPSSRIDMAEIPKIRSHIYMAFITGKKANVQEIYEHDYFSLIMISLFQKYSLLVLS